MSALQDEIRAVVASVLEEERRWLRQMLREELARASTAGDPDQLLDAGQVGGLLGMTPAAVRRAHERGRLGVEPVRVGQRGLRWRAGDVRALAQASGR